MDREIYENFTNWIELDVRLKCSTRNRRDFIVFLYLLTYTECSQTSKQKRQQADERYEVANFCSL